MTLNHVMHREYHIRIAVYVITMIREHIGLEGYKVF